MDGRFTGRRCTSGYATGIATIYAQIALENGSFRAPAAPGAVTVVSYGTCRSPQRVLAASAQQPMQKPAADQTQQCNCQRPYTCSVSSIFQCAPSSRITHHAYLPHAPLPATPSARTMQPLHPLYVLHKLFHLHIHHRSHLLHLRHA